MIFDVAIIGTGAWGGSAAYHLARRGRKVIAFDAFAPPHSHGSHHGRSRAMRMASYESEAYAPLMKRAFELWHELEREAGERLYRQIDAVTVGSPESEFVKGALATYARVPGPHEVLTALEVRSRFPSLGVLPDEIAVLESTCGILDPEACTRAHLRGAGARGAILLTDSPVNQWVAEVGGVRVETATGTYLAEQLIITAGSWAPALLQMKMPIQVERQVLVWFALRPGETFPPMFTFPSHKAEAFYGMPEPGGRLKVACHHGGQVGPRGTWPTEVQEDDLAAIQDELRQRLPFLAGRAPDAARTCSYTNSPDRHFILDRHPNHSQVLIATGDSGRGFKFSGVLGEAIADMLERRARPDVDFLSWSRFANTSGLNLSHWSGDGCHEWTSEFQSVPCDLDG